MASMRSRIFVYPVALLLLGVSVASAADINGKWSGTLESVGNSRGTVTQAHQMTIKQEGASIKGTAGPRPDAQWEIEDGKLEGNKLTFNSVSGQLKLTYALEVQGDSMAGTVTVTNRAEISWKIAMKRDK
jgi:hypothetical protein